MDPAMYERQRLEMVEGQIRARGISDEEILSAMERVPRHQFVPLEVRHKAYSDGPLAIGCKQTISQPYMVALMTSMLKLGPEDRVLEVGTGSAYQTAILAELAGTVVSIERHAPLVKRARDLMYRMDYSNVAVLLGDGTLGCQDCAPFDAILVTAGSPHVPPTLSDQLAVGGRMVCPIGTREAQEIVCVKRSPSGVHAERGIGCVFVPLIGKEGWNA